MGGVIMAYEVNDRMRPEDNLTVVTKDPIYHFVRSNPWVAVGWRTREADEVDLASIFANRSIDFKPILVAKVGLGASHVELEDGSRLSYDDLIIATGRELAFDETEPFHESAALNVLGIGTLKQATQG
ncbi:MAG: hypothetical protein ACLQB4_09150 [Beijerinckiaceae bacterium]